MAGGIGLLLISVGVASVTSPSTRRAPFQMAGMTTSGGDLQKRPQPLSLESGSSNEAEVSYRGFSMTGETLPPFRVTNLSKSLSAKEQFDIIAISHDGEVLGTVIPSQDNSVLPGAKRNAPRTYAVRWKNGVAYRLPIPKDAHRVVAGDINDQGDIAAISIQYRRGKPSFNRIIVYNHDKGYQDFGTLDTRYEQFDTGDSANMRGVSESLLCLNNQGTLIALVGSKSWFRCSDGVKAPIGEGIVFDMNNNNTAVGFSGTYASGAAMWRNAINPGKSAMTPMLPIQKSVPAGGQNMWRGSAECINDRDEAIIAVPIDSSNGFRRVGRTAYYLLRDGKLQLIAQMRGYQRARTRINNFGDVIGFADTDLQTQTVSPILYRDGKMYDLTNAAQQSGWKIIAAIDINNKRQIIAYGIQGNNGTPVPILLTPVR